MKSDSQFLNAITNEICKFDSVDAIYLYGSRAKGNARIESDWDIAVLYSTFVTDILEKYLRPQKLEAYLQKTFKMYDLISIIDVEILLYSYCLYRKMDSGT